ncbi:hypothetical protein EDD22DRAFT_957480 [Suillus occidentalis]|nr:hypothetical protein EDD22DRAFT_957480 [Suillus occidentalis]
MAPAKQRKGRGVVEISDSEVNPMAPLQQLKKGKTKADMNFLPRPVEDNGSQSNTQHHNPLLRMTGPDDRFGFKSSSTDKQDPREATQPISHSSKKAIGESIEDEVRKDRMWDLDEHDHNDQPSEDEDSLLWDTQKSSVDRMALCGDEDDEDGDAQMDLDQGDFDSQDSGNDAHHEATDTFDGPPVHVKLAQGLISIHPALDLITPPSNKAPSEKTALIRVRPECPPAHFSVSHSKSPCSSLFHKLVPHRRSPTHLCPGILLSQIEHLLPLLVQADLTLEVPHLFNTANLETLGFYPASWQAFLQAAKLEMQLQAILLHPLPVHQEAVILAQEVLGAVLWTYHMKEVKLDNGYFPEYKLCDNLFTFHTELKKIVISIAKQLYSIFSKGNSMHKERISAAAAKLLKTSEYLWLPDSSEGKYTNFVSQVLKEACLSFYYGNSKKALKVTDKFQDGIPVNGLILVAAVTKGVLSGFCDSGTDKSINKLMAILEHCVELEEMLKEWADEGMIGELRNDSDSAAGSDDINIII